MRVYYTVIWRIGDGNTNSHFTMNMVAYSKKVLKVSLGDQKIPVKSNGQVKRHSVSTGRNKQTLIRLSCLRKSGRQLSDEARRQTCTLFTDHRLPGPGWSWLWSFKGAGIERQTYSLD